MGSTHRSPELLLTILAFAAGITLLLIALGVTDGNGSGVDFAQAAGPQVAQAEPRPDPQPAPSPRPEPEIALPKDGTPILTVRDGADVTMHDAPDGQVVTTLTDTTEFDSPTVLSVAERRGNWAGVPSAELPNGKLGWVKLDDDGLKLDSVGQSIVLDLSSMTGRLYRGDDLERKWQIGIGAPATPTPTGRFSITDEIEGGLNPTYGCCAIALSAVQPNLPPGWTGGDRIAIHGTSLPLGEANSTGCPHSSEDDLHAIIEGVPLGTPVTIKG